MKSAARGTKKNRKGSAGPEAALDKNLCYHCENLALCSFVKRSRKPVLFCEEYAGNYAAGIPEAEHAVDRLVGVPDDDIPSYAGLCSTCESARTCMLRRQEGGVWRCNEYR